MNVNEDFVLKAHAAACSSWKQQIEEQFPDLFKKEVDLLKLKVNTSLSDKHKIFTTESVIDAVNHSHLLEIRNYGKYAGKAFWLSNEFNWEIKYDENKMMCLVPTKEK